MIIKYLIIKIFVYFKKKYKNTFGLELRNNSISEQQDSFEK